MIFEKIDKSKIVEQNIQKTVALEMVDAKRMAVIYKRAISELSQKLSESRPGSFTEARMKVVLGQLETTLAAINARLSKKAFDSASILARSASQDSIEELNTLEEAFRGVHTPIPFGETVIALDKNQYLLNRFIASLEAYNRSIRADIQRNLTQSLVARETYNQATKRLSIALSELQEWKVARIARTELHGIYNSSKILAMGQIKEKFIPKLMKALVHPMDSRTADDSKYLKDLNPIIPIDSFFEYTWNDKKRRFLSPPSRPNDRAVVVPVDESWK